jgi:hypothetical protein
MPSGCEWHLRIELASTTVDISTDDALSIHQADTNRLAASHITGGCRATRFCPRDR